LRDSLVEVLCDAAKVSLSDLPTTLDAVGTYLLFFTGSAGIYAPLSSTSVPLYIGKAEPRGGRTGSGAGAVVGKDLLKRVKEHQKSIDLAQNLSSADFAVLMVSTPPILVEAAERLLIQHYSPLWNSSIDGFGNHDPGKGRYNQKRSEWDTLHPGRAWANKLQPNPLTAVELTSRVERYTNKWATTDGGATNQQ
jgi:hypothetical protein